MSYLKMLERQKIETEKYERETAALRLEVLTAHDLYTLYDGEYLKELSEFHKAYKEKKLSLEQESYSKSE